MLRHPIFSATIFRVVALGVGLVGSVLIARLGGPELKGIFSAFTAANSIVFMFFNFDLPQQALREARQIDNRSFVGSALRKAWGFYLVLASLALVVIIISDLSIAWILLGAIFFTFVTQSGVAAIGLNGALIGAVGAAVQQVALSATVITFWQFGALNSTTIKLTALISYLVPVLLYLPFVLRAGDLKIHVTWRQIGKLVWTGLPWQLGRLMQMLLQRLDLIFVIALIGASASGIYSVGLSTAMLCTIIPAQISNQVLYEVAKDRAGKFRIRKQFLFALIAGLIPAGVLVILGQPLLTIVYGQEFAASYLTMLCCLPGAVAYGILTVQTNFVRIRGGWRPFLYMGVAAVLIMVILFLVLIPTMGEAGAGLAFSIATISSVLLGMIFFRNLFAA